MFMMIIRLWLKYGQAVGFFIEYFYTKYNNQASNKKNI